MKNILLQNKTISFLIKPLAFVIFVSLSAANSIVGLQQNPSPEMVLVFSTKANSPGKPIEVIFKKGEEFKDPLMAIWIEDLDGNYIQSLYVAQSIATGVFRHGIPSNGRWLPGPLRRPAALPYWGHKRGVVAEDGLFVPSQNHPMVDAITGATPKTSFRLQSRYELGNMKKFVVLLEINQSLHWNPHWNINKFPDDPEYRTSGQPAVVYAATVDLESGENVFEMTLIGHSHWSGATGQLFTDTSTLTTALGIANSITVMINTLE